MKKTIAIVGAAVAGLIGLSFVGAGKVQDYSDFIKKLKLSVSGIDRNSIRFTNFPEAAAKLDLRITNPTTQDFNLNGLGIVKVSRVFIKDAARNVVAETLVNQESISIPANSFTDIRNVELKGNSVKLLPLLREITLIKISIEIDVLGTKYIIEND